MLNFREVNLTFFHNKAISFIRAFLLSVQLHHILHQVLISGDAK